MRVFPVLALLGAVGVPAMSTPTPTPTATAIAPAPSTVAVGREKRASTAAEVPRAQRPRGTGAVVYVTAGRAYLDVGAADGLAPGAVIVARRGGAEAGRCTVDVVGDHHAACSSAALRPGDTLTFVAAPEPAAPAPLPTLPTAEELAVRAQAAAEAPVVRVEFRPAARREGDAGTGRRIVVAGFEHVSWASTGASTLSAERLDLALHGAPLGAGVLLDVEARAERWVPHANRHFRPEDDARLYVWQAQLTAPVSAVRLSAGRILPYRILGATVFDGASASVRRGSAELGLFGGAVPEPDTLSPTGDRATGGGFWSMERALGGGVLRHEGRLAVVRSPELGTRVEATLAGRAWLRAVDVSAEAQLGAGGEEQAAALVDAARVDLAARPTKTVSIGGSYRHTGLDWPDALEPALFPGRSDAADAWGAVELGSFLRVGATGGISRDAASKLDRTWVGPELGIPRLFGRRGGVVLGYLEEGGWLAGRSAYAQLVGRPWDPVRLLGRATWAHAKTLGADRDEVGLLASAAAELGRHFGLRLSALGRVPIRVEGGGSTPWGFTGSVALYAAY
ncbi:MAG TPA: hypothetical protein VLC54_11015 [Anaeromyxobacter sp.]|nr:hypothetical protein [Anaeromyxobacter sp.]